MIVSHCMLVLPPRNAFPPLDPLDEKKASYANPQELRTAMLNFLRVLDLHITSDEVTSNTVLSEYRDAAAAVAVSRQLSR